MAYRSEMRYCYCRNDYVLFRIHLLLNELKQVVKTEPECKAAASCANHLCRWKAKTKEGHDCTTDTV